MPQTLSKEWKEDLGAAARQIYEEWVHTIGNLTFSGYNTGLSNKRFAVKLQGAGGTPGYNRSNFALTKILLHCSKWGAEEIDQRGQELAQRAATIWSGPKLHTSVSANAHPENPFSEGGTRAKLFNILLDGNWHSVVTIQEQYRWDVPHRVERLRHIGAKNGHWKIEQDGDKVRMTWPTGEDASA